MNLSSDKKLLVREEKQLNDWLCSSVQAKGTLNLMELKGFLFGICTTPHMLPPQIWLATVFGDELVEFEGEQLGNNLPLIFQLYNYIQQQVDDGKFKLPFQPVVSADNLSDNFRRGNPLRDWSYGVDVALQLTMGFWDQISLDEADDEFIGMCQLSLTFFADEESTRSQFKKDAKTNKAFAEMSAAFAQDLPGIAIDYAELCRELYVENVDNEDVDLDFDDEQVDLFKDDDLSPVEDLMLQAQTAPTRQQATHLAKQALALDPNNLNINVFLADRSANIKEAIFWLEQAVACGEKALGESFFLENTGHFWLIHETRPYMEVLGELANAYLEANQFVRAIECYEKGLVLNPNDNQGLRHILIGVYIRTHELAKAEALLNTYDEDLSAFMRFSKLLLRYIQEGDSPAVLALKTDAKIYNRHVPAYLSGKHKIPTNLPKYFGIGDKNEAIIYAHCHRDVWRNTMGAISWLNK